MTHEERANQLREELVEILAGFAPTEGDFPIGHGVTVYRRDNLTALHHGESSISFCIIGQGKKHVGVGTREYLFTPEDIFITTAKLPTVSHVVEASPEKPYLGLSLELLPGEVKTVYLAAAPEAVGPSLDVAACSLTPIMTNLLDATVRLLRTLESPKDAAFLAPAIRQEIIYRLLTTDHEGRIRQIAGMNTVSNQIKRALDQLKEEIHRPLKVSDLADMAGMSISSFHEHFKKVTGLTPLQYQKQLRLREARHRIRTEDIDVAEAGYAVGYNDASHFNRDYKRMFGITPLRDLEQMRMDEYEEAAS